jgi:uncharacterized lipoprotein YddW (UPF0748 family)
MRAKKNNLKKSLRTLYREPHDFNIMRLVFYCILLICCFVWGTAFALDTPYLSTFQNETTILPNDELRAIWVVRDALTSQQRIDEMIDFCVRSRIQMIFAQVRGRGDAYYRSRLEPEGKGLELPASEFDPLEYLLIRAHASGLSVHVWVNVYYVWSDPFSSPPERHVCSLHPEWLVADPAGDRVDTREVNAWIHLGVEGYFLSPSHPEARSFIVRVIQDIAERYTIDGLHLDYIRYPAAGFGLDPVIRRNFMLYWGVDPLHLGRDWEMLAAAGENTAAVFDSLIIEKRTQAVDSLVLAVREVIGDLPLSAAIIPEYKRAREEKGQDWARWVQEGTVDFIVPMAYSYNPPELRRRMRLVRNLVGRDKFLIGLPLFDGRAARLASSISYLREDQVLGYALFSYNVMEGQRFAVQFLNEVFFEVDEENPEP